MRYLLFGVALLILCQPAFGAEPLLRLNKPMDPVKTTTAASRARLQASTVETSFKPITTIKIKPDLAKLKNIRPIKPDSTVKPVGPDSTASLDLSDIIDDPRLLADLGEACGFDPHLLFQDQKASHVFYYLPRILLLTHGENGYGLSVQYNHQAEPGAPSVMLTGIMAAPFGNGDTILLKAILRKGLGLAPSDELKLKALPGLGSKADMQALTAGLALPPDRIHLTAPAHLRQSFRISLSLTQDETEEIMAQMGREGLAGSLHVPVDDTAVPVPILMQYTRFAGDLLQGFDRWISGKTVDRIVNLSLFPVKLTSINAYRMQGDKLERISKNLKQSSPIPPEGSKRFRLPSVQRVLGENLLVVWPGTRLETDCESCLQEVDGRVRQGVALSPGEQLKIEAIPSVFSEFGLYKMIVRIQSPYFTAGADRLNEREIELTAEANTNNDLLLYLPGGESSNPLLYRYKLRVVKESGETFQDDEWRRGESMSQFIGSTQLERFF